MHCCFIHFEIQTKTRIYIVFGKKILIKQTVLSNGFFIVPFYNCSDRNKSRIIDPQFTLTCGTIQVVRL